MFHPYGDITFTGEGLQILTYTRHSVNSEGSLAAVSQKDIYTGHLKGPVRLTPNAPAPRSQDVDKI